MDTKSTSEVVVTKDKIIRDIAKKTNRDYASAKDFYGALEDMFTDYLKCANADTTVRIKLFNGITVDGIYVPEHENKRYLINSSDSCKKVKSKIKTKFTVSRQFCKNLNEKHK